MENTIDYDPVGYKTTVAAVNNFVVSTTQFINRFSYLCEQKLSDVNQNIQRLEITMNILEAKLSSIPDVEGAESTSSSSSSSTTTTTTAASSTNTNTGEKKKGGAPPPPPPPPPPGGAKSITAPGGAANGPSGEANTSGGDSGPSAETAGAAGGAGGGMTWSQDPRYAKYFKMVRVGVPENVVKNKVAAEGLNPAAIDNPDGPSDATGGLEDDDETHFSDDETVM